MQKQVHIHRQLDIVLVLPQVKKVLNILCLAISLLECLHGHIC